MRGGRSAESLHFTSDFEDTPASFFFPYPSQSRVCVSVCTCTRQGLPLICALSVCCGVLCCGHVSLDAMNLLLPEHERESDELFDASVSVKQEPLLAAEAKDQLLQQPMDEEKEALGQDDDKDEEEPGVLLSLSQLPSAPGGPGRSRILALDKLTELGASEGPAGKEEEKEAAEDEESEWQSNWQSPAAAVHTSRHKPTSTATAAHQRATTPQRRKKVLVEHEEGTEDGQLEERDPRVEASQRTEVVERRQSLRTPSRAKVSIKQQQRADGGSGKQREAVESSMKKRMKSK